MENGKLQRPGLARADEGDRLQADLDRMLTDRLLAHSDRGAALTRDLDTSASLTLPSLAEIDNQFAQKEEQPAQSNNEIADLLSIGSMDDIAMEGMRLTDLLARGGTSLKEMATLKRGMLFLRKRMYSEATEWWILNRPKEAMADPRFYCICTLLLAFTYQLAGHTREAEASVQDALRIRKMI